MTAASENVTLDNEVDKHQRAIRANPGDARAHALLGLRLQELGRMEDAVASQRRAMQLDPQFDALHESMAPALHALGQHDASIDSYRRAIAIQGDNAKLHAGLSDVLYDAGQLEQAVASALQAIELRPEEAAYHFSLGKALQGTNDHARAAETFRRVLALAPGHAEARFQLGRCLRALKQYDAAGTEFVRVLEVHPDSVNVIHAYSLMLIDQQRLEDAHACLEDGLRKAPHDERLLMAMTYVCFELGKGAQALQMADRANALNPGQGALMSMRLFMLSHCCTDAREFAAEHLKFGEQWDGLRWAPHANSREPQRQLRIGFVSADLYNHAVSTFIEPVFTSLGKRTSLSLHVYDNGTTQDEVTQRLRACVASWTPIRKLDDETVAGQIRADGIDILIDLSGHSLHNRLPMFALKPAPVQASWIGYAGTTGLKAMDYYLADQFFLPEGRYDDQFSEQIVRLPLGAPFHPDPEAPPINSLPALRNGYLTFGSFHRANKISREVVTQWCKLLRALPASRLLLGGQTQGSTGTLLGWFDEEGIERERLLVRWRAPAAEYLRQHYEVDVCLTPFPYTGSTTVAHALWMGVPTLTTVGQTSPSHAAACYTTHLGLSSFIAPDDETFVKLGVFLSENVEALSALRAGMREQFRNSMLGYPGITAVALEHAFRLMWQRWCAGLAPEKFQVRLSDLQLEA